MPKLIIFDMDGVLIDSETIIVDVMSRVLTDLGIPITPAEAHAKFVGMSTPASMSILEQMSSKATVERFVALSKPEIEHRLQTELKTTPHIETILAKVQSSGRAMCVASNSTSLHVTQSLTHAKLVQWFPVQHRYSGRDMPAPKPAPDLHLHCLEQFGVTPDQALVVEDSLTGARAAVAANVPFIGYVGVHPHPEDQAKALQALGARHVVHSWQELAEDLNALTAGHPH